MSTKRMVSIIIAVLNAILFVGLFLPFSQGINVFNALDSNAYLIIIFAIVGMLMCILNKKIELNYLTGGAILGIFTPIIINYVRDYSFGSFFSSVSIGFFAYFLDGILLVVMTTIHGTLTNNRRFKSDKATTTTSNGNVSTQQTNSLNMNVPVNNFKSLPIKRKEKKKAPMDMLMQKESNQPANVQSHMSELGLHSINISKDNLTGVDPNAQQTINVQQPVQQPAQPVVEMQPAQTPMTVNNLYQAPGQVQQPAPAMPQQPMQPQAPRPDLLAGSEMSGQMDNSPYNPNNNQGPGIFF